MLSGRRDVCADGGEQQRVFDDFVNNFELGRRCVARAVELEERNRGKDEPRLMVEACENYKEGMAFLKAANSVRLMECQKDRRNEVIEMRKKAESFIRSSEERFLVLTRQLGIAPETGGCVNGQSTSTDSGSSARPTTRAASDARNRVAPAARPSSASRAAPARIAGKAATSSSDTRSSPTRDALLKGVDSKFGNALLDEMLDSTGVRLDDVAGAEAAKAALEEAVIFPAINPALFSGLRQPVKGILLFGPPGNGKTMLAKAVATEAGQVFFNLSAASLTSKWVGDAEKTVRSLFQIARNAQPCIIFIDEIDSILCERSSKEADSSRRLKTEFLVQFDGASSAAEDRILVIGATNRPHELDDAVLRRFPKRIMLGLPDESARAILIRSTLTRHKADTGLRDSDIRRIARQTEGYSNSDLVALCKEAAMMPVRQITRERLATVQESRIRPILLSDFEEALHVIRPSTNKNALKDMSEFAARAGQAS